KLSKSNLKGKKSALQKGIEASRGDLIITIDADSNPAEKTWIKTFVSCYEQKKSKLIIAPISLRKDDGFLNGFESIDVLGLSLTTAGSAISGNPIMCNGANLSFDRQAFCEVGGYLGNENVSSGDDVFLLNKIHAKYPGLVHYLKSQDAIVLTDGNKNLNSFIAQRIRWAGKFSSNKNLFNSYLGVLVFFCNFLFLVFALLSCFFHELANFLIVLALLKWFIDFLLVFLSALFLKQPHVLRWYAISIIVYPFYVCLIAGLSLLVKPKWKGRKI
ncbi:MAG TPA: glycosyltransferase family 2 protein, partial [Nitrosopumilaceae archaeon]|nr:glycosyltransferase family 2 protein [Nitrosopumilaceae archaeon]